MNCHKHDNPSSANHLRPDCGVSESEFPFCFFLLKDPRGNFRDQEFVQNGTDEEEYVDSNWAVPVGGRIRLI